METSHKKAQTLDKNFIATIVIMLMDMKENMPMMTTMMKT